MTTTNPVRTRFGERSTAAEVAAGVDLSDRRAIVIGASSGIGVESARVLADHGAAVTLAVRDSGTGGSVAASIRASTGNEADVVSSRADSDGRHGVAAYALDEGNAERLWEMSERLTAG